MKTEILEVQTDYQDPIEALQEVVRSARMEWPNLIGRVYTYGPKEVRSLTSPLPAETKEVVIFRDSTAFRDVFTHAMISFTASSSSPVIVEAEVCSSQLLSPTEEEGIRKVLTMVQNRLSSESMRGNIDHINKVRELLTQVTQELTTRGDQHDASKLLPPEAEGFEIYSKKLKDLVYGSPEYQQCLKDLKPTLDHHYQVNRHHPEHYQEGIRGMNLLDLMELLADWKAATLRHKDGDLAKSLEINEKRFEMSTELKNLLLRTAKDLGWIGG